MPYFRFIVEGSDFEMPTLREDRDEEDGLVTGFFTGRRIKAPDMGAARASILEDLGEEWREYSPTLTIIDAWKAPFIELRGRANAGHCFFSDEYGRYACASVEAEASRAPKSAAVWELAALNDDDDDE
jgi:hypothetical protein